MYNLKKKTDKTPFIQFQLFVSYKAACLPKNFHGRTLSIRLFFCGRALSIRAFSADGHYINNSLHLARKYARIFVLGHYLFREANSFPRAKLEENCELRGTDNVQGQISEHIFAPNGDYCLYYPSNLFRNARSFENWGIFNNYTTSPSFLRADSQRGAAELTIARRKRGQVV